MPETEPKVSVVVPAYDTSDSLEKSLLSIAVQTFPDFEAIIVDHGTSGITGATFAHYIPDSRMKYFRIEKGSPLGAAKKFGISNASGQHIILLYNDDAFKPDCLKVLDSELDKLGPEFAGVYANADYMDENRKIYRTRKSREFGDSRDAVKALLSDVFIPILTPTIMFRKEILEKYPSDESLGPKEDFEQLIRILKDYRLKHVDETVYNYRTHSGNYSRRARLQCFGIWKKIYERHVGNPWERKYLLGKRCAVELMKSLFEKVSDWK